MLFSSYTFIFIFLPLVLLAFHSVRYFWGGQAAVVVSVAASIIFYGWWNPPYLLLIAVSITANFFWTQALVRTPKKLTLFTALVFNLSLLGYFKYRNFFLENMNFFWHGDIASFGSLELIFIPLGISFYTFQQIALLIDAHDGAVDPAPTALEYSQFILFFPQLIAGPIVLYREITHQISNMQDNRGEGISLLGVGIAVFVLGLFKKVCLADGIAPFADIAFSTHETITLLEAWAGTVSYALQLYFDFSGYSDMALGLGLMFGFHLPLNFDTPYRACNMIDFWKRWHITMTRFFMMYVYSPLALSLSRFGSAHFNNGVIIFIITVASPTLATFLVSGLWHGAGWTFVAFGVVNGIGLTFNHAWKQMKAPKLPFVISWGVTMLCVLVSFVYFRAPSIVAAHNMLSAMFDPSSLILPNWLETLANAIGLPWRTLNMFASGTFAIKCFVWIFFLGSLSLLLPNWAKNYLALKPSWSLAFTITLLTALAIGQLSSPQTFLYFQF